MLVYFMTIWNILPPLGVFYGRWVQFVVIWYIFSSFDMFGPRKIWQPCQGNDFYQSKKQIIVDNRGN
jgi:hypothetical protein